MHAHIYVGGGSETQGYVVVPAGPSHPLKMLLLMDMDTQLPQGIKTGLIHHS